MGFDNINVKDFYMIHFIPDKKAWKCENRTHHILGIHLKGRARHKFSDREFTIRPQDVYFFNQKDEYNVEVLERTEAYSVHFSTYEPIDTESFCFNVKNTTPVINLLKKLENQLVQTPNSRNIELMYFYELCEYYNSLTLKKYQPTNERFLEAKKYIDINFKDKNCVDVASELYGVTRRRFNDVFKNNENCTPNDYITDKKLALAEELLNTNMFSVSKISQICGFDDVSYFSKVFKKCTGKAPSKYNNS